MDAPDLIAWFNSHRRRYNPDYRHLRVGITDDPPAASRNTIVPLAGWPCRPIVKALPETWKRRFSPLA